MKRRATLLRSVWTCAIASVGVMTLQVLPVLAQANQAARPEFEVASVKARPVDIETRASLEIGATSLVAINYPLMGLISLANGSTGQLEKLPTWAQSARFDIRATASKRSSRAEMRDMLRALLEERFKLKTHSERRVMDAYALAFADPVRLGPNLHLLSIDCETNKVAPGSDQGIFRPDERPKCGISLVTRFGRTSRIQHAAVPLAKFGESLRGVLGRPVVDRTGRTELFDILLEFEADSHFGPGIERPDEKVPPPIRVALKEQLGLVVSPARAPVEFLIIDSLEHPSAD